MIHLRWHGSTPNKHNTFSAVREGRFVVLRCHVKTTDVADPVFAEVLCCTGAERHHYKGAFALHRLSGSEWAVEAGVHHRSLPMAAFLLTGVPEDIDLFALPEGA